MELKPMATLPETGFLRLTQIVGDPKAYPPTPALMQIPDDPGHGFHVIPAGDSI